MKQGTLEVYEENKVWYIAIRRADGGLIKLQSIETKDAFDTYNGKPCQYFGKGKNIELVKVDGETIYEKNKPFVSRISNRKSDTQQSYKSMMKDESEELILNEIKEKQELPDSFSIKKSQIPSDVRRLRIKANEIDNFNLKLNKFARFEEYHKMDNGRKKTETLGFFFFNPQVRKDWMNSTNKKNKEVVLPEFEIKFPHEANQQILQELLDKHISGAKKVLGTCLCKPIFKPEWRTIIGLGGASVYETSITLHHLYGFPYIPASSIKGVVRSYIIQKVFMSKYSETDEKAGEKGEKDALKNPEFAKIFGTQKQQGKVIFFDAYPVGEIKLVADVMTPHYPKWYGDGDAPTDTQSPVPIPFLTVEDTQFQFLFGAKHHQFDDLKVGGKDLGRWLEEALTHQGIGAKTAVGYGRMQKTK